MLKTICLILQQSLLQAAEAKHATATDVLEQAQHEQKSGVTRVLPGSLFYANGSLPPGTEIAKALSVMATIT
jgi:hypothetical protein